MTEKRNNISLKCIKKVTQLRTCIACRKKTEKKNLLRIVKQPDGKIVFDETGCADGRGTYICNDVECFNKLRKNRLLNRAFKCEVKNEVYDAIEEAFVGKQEQN